MFVRAVENGTFEMGLEGRDGRCGDMAGDFLRSMLLQQSLAKICDVLGRNRGKTVPFCPLLKSQFELYEIVSLGGKDFVQ